MIAITIFNCSSDDSSNDDPKNCSSDISFLVEGRVMQYKITSLGFETGEATLTFTGCNSDGFLVERSILAYSTNETTTATDLWKEDGDFLVTDANYDNDYFAKIYKKNAQLGDIWTHARADGSLVTHEVIAVDSSITVPAGTFNCKVFKYSTETTINETFVSWNEDVGNIKEDGGGFFNLELTSFE